MVLAGGLLVLDRLALGVPHPPGCDPLPEHCLSCISGCFNCMIDRTLFRFVNFLHVKMLGGDCVLSCCRSCCVDASWPITAMRSLPAGTVQNRLYVMINWTLALLFGRDVSRW